MSFLTAIKGVSGAFKAAGGAISQVSKSKTDRISAVRGGAAPVIFFMTSLPFIVLLFGMVFGSLYPKYYYITERAMAIINAMGAVYFFSIITILLTGTAGAASFSIKKKAELEIEKQKTEQKKIEQKETDAFSEAVQHILDAEGGYVNHPKDKGGETYKGIARKFWPDWEGWRKVDRLSRGFRKTKFPQNLEDDAVLQTLVQDFYRVNFWNAVEGDRVNKISRKIALELFDTAVNQGRRSAVKYLQQAIINCSYGLGINIKADGVIGDKTIAALETLCPAYESAVYKSMNGEQYLKYVRICEKDESQKVFFRGWMRRV